MIIKQLHINKFRGFSNVDCEVWSHITIKSAETGELIDEIPIQPTQPHLNHF